MYFAEQFGREALPRGGWDMMSLRGAGMRKYALFGGDGEQPLLTFDGDEMVLHKEYVHIYRREKTPGSPIPKQVRVAAVRLSPGQSVKEIRRQPLSREDSAFHKSKNGRRLRT